jgi:hypothetical protein
MVGTDPARRVGNSNMDDQPFGQLIHELYFIRWSAVIVALLSVVGLIVLLRHIYGSLLLRFSIRDLLWLMVAVGLASGWWLNHDSIRKQRLQLDLEKAEVEQKSAELDKLRESVKTLLQRQSLK